MNNIYLTRLKILTVASALFLACGCCKRTGFDEIRKKEIELEESLYLMRNAIDQYTQDKNEAPQRLSDLVATGYLHQIPKDPITGSANTWQVVQEDTLTSVDQSQPGIVDVHGGSDQISSEGTPYSSW